MAVHDPGHYLQEQLADGDRLWTEVLRPSVSLLRREEPRIRTKI